MLHCEVHGKGPDLVMLHGWGMNAGVWSPLLDRLADAYRVHLVELPGHGYSGFPEVAADLDAWVELVLQQTPSRAAWLGWSLGGQIAQRAVILAPERVSRLVLVASSPRFTQDEDWPHAMAGAVLQQFAQSLMKHPGQTLERFLSLQVKGDAQARELLRSLRRDFAGRPQPHARALTQGLELLLNVDLRATLPQISCPSLWLLGERDTLVPADVGDAIEALMPTAQVLILSGAAHAPFLSHPVQALAALRHFLQE